MSLLTDQYVVTAAEMNQMDSEVEDVARAHSITLDGEYGLTARATGQVIQQLESSMQVAYGGCGELTSNHIAALMNTGLGSAYTNSVRLHPGQICVHGELTSRVWSPLKMWAMYKAIEILYQEVGNRLLGSEDRYSPKAIRYRELAGNAWNTLAVNGVQFVLNPLPCPGAVLVAGSGDWNDSRVTLIDAPGAAGGVFRVAVAWTTVLYDASQRGNDESGPSPTVSVTVPADKSISVSIAGLKVPDGSNLPGGSTLPLVATKKASHWQALIGGATGALYVQNADPIPVDTTSYQLTENPTLSGLEASPGQTAQGKLKMFQQTMRW